MQMSKSLSRRCVSSAAAVVLAGALGTLHAAAIVYNDFSSVAGLTLNGDAAQAGNVLRVTSAGANQSGSTFATSPITLGAGYAFSTFFAFQISNSGGISDGDGTGADGLTFTIQTNANTAGGNGGGIGYQGIANSVGIEFDTYDNGGGLNDPNGNHIGINIGGGFNGATTTIANRMNNGAVWYAWADYNGTTLEVRVAETLLRPSLASLARTVDLSTALGTPIAFIGFTSGTGAAWGNHDILRWEFRDSFNPIDPGNGVPTPLPIALLMCGALALCRFQRRDRA